MLSVAAATSSMTSIEVASRMTEEYIILMKYSYVYMMANKTNTTLYIGVTNNLARRIYEHKEKLVPGFTQKYNLTKLVYFEVFEDINSAISREKALKNLVRRKKDLLIEKDNPNWDDLYTQIV